MQPAFTIVDCHPHIYAASAGQSAALGYPTIFDNPASRGTSQPGGHSANSVASVPPETPHQPAATADLKDAMGACGVSKAVFIQTSSFHGFDNSYVIASAVACADWAVGVVTLDPDAESDLAVLETAAASNCKGLRALPDKNGRINSPNVQRLWQRANELGMVVNLHCQPVRFLVHLFGHFSRVLSTHLHVGAVR